MICKTRVRRGEYFDSVTLLQIAQDMLRLPGVADAAVVMGTPANKGILTNAELLEPASDTATPDDLILTVRAESADQAEAALDHAETELRASGTRQDGDDAPEVRPRTVAAAAKRFDQANLTLISVAGHFAADVAVEALESGTHVFLFSDNVPLADEIRLKTLAREKGLLVMGPDAGTAIVNGVALGFANAVPHSPPAPGGVGIVAASGTGLQAVTCELARRGVGITQAIGTGGRDLSAAVGGMMMVDSLKALQIDPDTRVIILISKPPAKEVAEHVLESALASHKPCVICFLGARQKDIATPGVIPAATLELAAAIAAEVALGGDPEGVRKSLKKRNKDLRSQAYKLRATLGEGQRYFRGLFSGGTFCYETQVILHRMLPGDRIYSNAPVNHDDRLSDASVSLGHTAVDLGEDEFTQGRLHPMLDPTLRNRRIAQEARDPETAIIYLDVVLGYGVHPDPAGSAAEAIREAQGLLAVEGRTVVFIAHVCGTNEDPQNLKVQEARLRDVGVVVLPTNAAATRLAGYLLQRIDETYGNQ
ncbi:MAG: acyl-CoA synthetase FdrA [Anaerolineae bacterium]|nr:acyl-CoA synthetase FdrA [Anaerolineae bacterium]